MKTWYQKMVERFEELDARVRDEARSLGAWRAMEAPYIVLADDERAEWTELRQIIDAVDADSMWQDADDGDHSQFGVGA